MMTNHPCACAGMGLLGLKKSACFIRDRVVSSARHCKFSGRPWPVDEQKAQQRPTSIAGAFFVPAIQCYGGLRGDTFGCAGFLLPRSANPAQSATLIRLAANGGSSSAKGATS